MLARNFWSRKFRGYLLMIASFQLNFEDLLDYIIALNTTIRFQGINSLDSSSPQKFPTVWYVNYCFV